ncbi:MAG: hypothetical protein JKY56_22115 [Kofleriaceae bacterium]|nr:hypothetical protein [Kofleriaceae bacterium]
MQRLSVALAVLFLLFGCSSSAVSRELGAQCNDNSDCDDRCVSGADYPDGLCTVSCGSDRECPGGARCIDKEGGICLFSCTDTADCEFLGQGWKCKSKDLRSDDQMEVMVCFGE